MQLLTSLTTPYGRIVRIINREHGLGIEEVFVKIWQEREKVSAYNPVSKIPVLLLDDDTPIIDSRVIAEYLDSLGANPLLPTDPDALLRMRTACALCMAVLDSAATAFGPATMFGTTLPAKIDAWLMDKVRDGLADIERRLQAGEFGAQDSFNMLDVFVVSTLGFIEFRLADRVPWRINHPRLAEFFDHLHISRTSVSDTVPAT